MVVVGIFEVSLKTSDTQRRKERTFIEYCPVLGITSRDSTQHLVSLVLLSSSITGVLCFQDNG